MKKISIRCGIIFFWVALIFCALYWPKWKIFHYDEKTLNIFAWGDILEPGVIAEFEQETGIKVNLNYYSSNEELLVKMKATKGEGFDLIIPSDYAVNILVQEELLKKIDKDKLTFWNRLNPSLLGHFFDPQNTFSIPFEWEIFGLGIDKEYFAKHPAQPSWGMIFDPSIVNYKITMNNDPIEAIEFASFYLYGIKDSLNPEETQAIKQLLIQQNPWVTAYANFRGDYFLATRNCAVVVASSSYIWRTMRLFDFVGFVVPKEGTFITIENLCIPKASSKDDLAYKLINYLYQPHSVASHFKTFGFFPAALHAIDVADIDKQAAELLQSAEQDFHKYHFYRTVLPEETLRDIWVEVKTESY